MQVGFNNPEAMQEFVRMQEGMRDTERKLAQCVKRAQGRSIERRRVAVSLHLNLEHTFKHFVNTCV
jgi:trehalose-6-phosphatase